nr:ORF2 [Torque teno felis virus]QYD02252.1 ORF2 [Torque teno felis virus]
MQPPFPSPALMLPAIDLSRTPDLDSHISYKKRECLWKRQVSLSHAQWCLCGSYLNHFLPPDQPLRNSCGDGADGGDVLGATGESEDASRGGDSDEDFAEL